MWVKRFKNVITAILLLIYVPIILFLTYYSFRYSMWFKDIPYDCILLDMQDSIVLHIVVALGVLVLFYIVGHIFHENRKRNELYLNILLYSVMFVVFSFCLWWVLEGNFFAQNDSRFVLESMEAMRNGDYSSLLPSGYIGTYKQHLGLMTLIGVIFEVTHTVDNIVIQIVNAICASMIIFIGFHILKEITIKLAVRAYYCLFMLFCFPLLFYTPYVYGEIISATAGMGFIWAAICYIKRGNLRAYLALCLCAVIGNMARGNFPVLLIAFTIIAVLYAIRQKRIMLVVCSFSLFIVITVANMLNTLYYERISGIALDQGIPVEGWIAMGLTDSGDGECGMHNGWHRATYVDFGFDREATKKQSLALIRDRLTMFLNGAGISPADFYKAKILLQWNDPTANCFMENRCFIPDPHPFIRDVIDADIGIYREEAREAMNQYQWILYLGVLLYCFFLFRENAPFYSLLILVILLGGFLFTVIWEAMSRYVFPYIIYMVPLAAIGWYNLQDVCRCLLSKLLNKKYINKKVDTGENL